MQVLKENIRYFRLEIEIFCYFLFKKNQRIAWKTQFPMQVFL